MRRGFWAWAPNCPQIGAIPEAWGGPGGFFWVMPGRPPMLLAYVGLRTAHRSFWKSVLGFEGKLEIVSENWKWLSEASVGCFETIRVGSSGLMCPNNEFPRGRSWVITLPLFSTPAVTKPPHTSVDSFVMLYAKRVVFVAESAIF